MRQDQAECLVFYRTGQVLFIDARNLGHMIDRAVRAFDDEDIAKIASTYHAWRATSSAKEARLSYKDRPGFCYSATLEDIKDADYALTPGRYVSAADTSSDDEPIDQQVDRLSTDLLKHLEISADLADVVRKELERIR